MLRAFNLQGCQNAVKIFQKEAKVGTSLRSLDSRLRVFSVGDTGLIPALGPSILRHGIARREKINEKSLKIFPASVEGDHQFSVKKGEL